MTILGGASSGSSSVSSDSPSEGPKPLALLSQAAGVLEKACRFSEKTPQVAAVANLLAVATAAARKSLLEAKPSPGRGQGLDKHIEHNPGTLAKAKEAVLSAQETVAEAQSAFGKATEAATARRAELDALVEARAAVGSRAKEVPRAVGQRCQGLFGQASPEGFAGRKETKGLMALMQAASASLQCKLEQYQKYTADDDAYFDAAMHDAEAAGRAITVGQSALPRADPLPQLHAQPEVPDVLGALGAAPGVAGPRVQRDCGDRERSASRSPPPRRNALGAGADDLVRLRKLVAAWETAEAAEYPNDLTKGRAIMATREAMGAAVEGVVQSSG